MKKKLICILLCGLLVVGAVLTIAACTPKNDEHVLNIVVLDKGYGTDWIKPLVEKFKEENAGYDVKIENSADAATLINNHINSRNNVDDLYISVGASWLTYAEKGLFAELDDIMDDEIDGIALKDKVSSEYASSVLYPDMKTGELHTYRLPWISGTGGIFYNKKMFEKYNWNVPATFEELLTLCDTIATANIKDTQAEGKEYVKPFVYTGTNSDYFDYAVYTWWGQLAGENAIKDFTNYSSKDNFNATTNATYGKLKQAVEMWNQLIGNDKYVNRTICSGADNYNAQNAFAQGRAAMMFNGDWIYNEMLPLMSDYNKDTFELGFMPLPTATGAVDTEMLYTVGEDQWIAVPASSIKQDLAKKFIKIMVSDFGCKTFLQKANGMLAYKCNYEESDYTNSFLKELVEIRNACSKPFTDYPKDMSGDVLNSTRMLYLSHDVHNIWGTSAWRPYDNILNSGKSVDAAFNDIVSGVNREWPTWLKNNGLS